MKIRQLAYKPINRFIDFDFDLFYDSQHVSLVLFSVLNHRSPSPIAFRTQQIWTNLGIAGSSASSLESSDVYANSVTVFFTGTVSTDRKMSFCRSNRLSTCALCEVFCLIHLLPYCAGLAQTS